tara:strand:+ start:77 stop:727 length:651 start_codon:yes stop_codon:yes gene_type:complete
MKTDYCPLCMTEKPIFFYQSERVNLVRDFLQCTNCELVFVPSDFHLSLPQQRDRYLEHNNDPMDSEYRAFLSRLRDPLLPLLKEGDVGLDFGCGPGPALAQMLRDSGYKMDLYDPLFWDDNSALEKSYDFVTCTETIEHFSNPASDFALLDSVVKDEGVLGVMTSILYKEVIFEDWYYKLDPTHVSFYTPSTMEWISNKFNWAIESTHKNVYFFIK